MFSKIFDIFIHCDTDFASRNLLKKKPKEETFKSVIKGAFHLALATLMIINFSLFNV